MSEKRVFFTLFGPQTRFFTLFRDFDACFDRLALILGLSFFFAHVV